MLIGIQFQLRKTTNIAELLWKENHFQKSSHTLTIISHIYYTSQKF